MKKTKKTLMSSAVALLLCFSMLLGTTYAWFTDSVGSDGNIIQSGSLDVEMYWSENLLAADSSEWKNADGVPIFTYDNWEPGYTDVKYVKIRNAGNLSLQWRLNIEAEGEVGELADVIDVYYVNPVTQEITTLSGLTSVGILSDVIEAKTNTSGVLLPKGEKSTEYTVYETILAIAFHMDEKAENKYQGSSIGNGFSVNLIATQFGYEKDAFGKDYDKDSQWPENVIVGNNSAAADIVTDADNKVSSAVNLISNDGAISATVPTGVKVEQGTNKLTLTVNDVANSKANVTLNATEAMLSIDVHIDGVAADNEEVMAVGIKKLLPVGLNMGNYRFYHVEDGATVEMTLLASGATPVHNNYEYDPATGDVVLYLKSFSEVATIADTENAWKGEFNYEWYNANATELTIANADQLAAFGAIVGGMAKLEDGTELPINSFKGKTIKLLANINLGDKESENNPDIIFYPIGYYNSDGTYERTKNAITSGFRNFEGTFDGNGNTIANFYQNTWEMKGDHDWYTPEEQYYRDGMGLFGRVYGGTVKNLTVDNFSSDGEIATTGVIAAYAEGAKFENIAVTNCNPRVYNIGNGGIVGCVGWYAKEKDLKTTFTNITVDNSNKISALWGSYDVACGGIVGQYYPTSGQTSAGTPKNAGIEFTNCHVSAIMDVYNDVCANYQYYAYRYTGMIIGSIRENETIGGHVYPKMDGITASGCTVHFGDWNDYYYCELVANSLASYTHDHQMSRLTQVASVDVANKTVTDLKGNTTAIPASGRVNYVVVKAKDANGMWIHGDGHDYAECYHFVNGVQHFHDVADSDNPTPTETVNGVAGVLKEDKQLVYREFNQLFTGYGWGVTSKGIGDLAGVTILDREVANSVVKFESKFTGDFLYRVGNKNTVNLDSLFKVKEDLPDALKNIVSSGVWVTIEPLNDNMNVSGTFTADKNDWTKGTIQFSSTGVVKVTIQDYVFCTPTVIYLEVVDAVNATEAKSATANNVVLLNNCGFSSLEVSGGYALYGNGFTMTCASDSVAADMGYAFVTLNNGTLDNVQIVCPNFDYAALYKSNLTSSDNRSETYANGKTRYYNAKSGVMASGNSQILNSRISGARAAVNVSGGNVVIDNSRIELGAVASILVGAANSLTLRDVTLIQKPTASTYDSNKKLMGFSVLYLCDSEGKATPTTLEGSFVQQAWVNADDKQYVPSAGQDIVDGVMKETAFIHNINGKDSLNLGFAYMPEDAQKTVAAPDNITDNRTDKATIPYEMKDVKIQISILSTTVYVYSYKNTNGTADSFITVSEYKPNKYSDIITVSYSDTADGLTTGKSYGTDGWVYELNVDLDKLSGYALDFSKISMSVNGVAVTDFKVNGNAKPSSPVAVTAGGVTYTLTATVNGKEYTATYKVTGTETSKESPSLVGTPSYGAGFGVANKYGGDWSAAAPVLDGITIKYWSVADSEYKEFSLSSITFANTGKQNGTNNYWEYTHTNNDFTLKLTNTAAIHSNSGTYGMPVVGKDGKLYFTIASSGGFVSTGTTSRSITIAYEFTDNNGGDTLKFSNTWSIPYSKDEQYNYSSFTSDGTLTKLEAGSSSGSCLTPDTLITLADGTQVRVDSLTGNEELLVWNMETGKFDKAPIMFVDSDPSAEYEIVHLYFSDGTDVKVIYEHGFWDYDLNKYVYLDRYAEKYIGHTFAKQNGDRLEKVQLTDVVIETEVTTAWSPVTVGHLCYFVNGMLSMPGGVGGLFNIFDVDPETMTYDYEAMQKDIETYGLYTYDELNAICPLSEEMFNAAGGAYLKISIGKGNLTEDELVEMIARYSKFFD